MMKIAYIVHQFLPFHNSGTEQYVYHLAKGLQSRGEDVQIFCFEANFEKNLPFTGISKDSFDGIPVTRLSGWAALSPNYPLAQYYNPFFGKIFGEFLMEEGIELVHFFHTGFLGLSLIEEAFLAKIPTVVNLMDFWFLCPNVQLLKTSGALCTGPADFRECLRCLAPKDANYRFLDSYDDDLAADFLPDLVFENVEIDHLATSASLHKAAALAARPDSIRRILGLVGAVISPSEFLKSVFVDNGYDPDTFRLAAYGIKKDDLEKCRSTPRDGDEGLRVGYVGTISAHKGLDVLIRAFHRIEGEDASLEVHGSMEDFPEFSGLLRELSADDPRIHFNGRFESCALPDVLSRIDVLVVPSIWYENTPFVILEALASGTPVIASNLGGLSELIEDGKNGFLFRAGDSDDLRDKIAAFIDDKSLLERLMPDFSSVRSLDDNMDEFLSLYKELAERGNRGGGDSMSENSQGRMREMDTDTRNHEEREKLLHRHIHHLTSQVFHMVDLNAGHLRQIAELERVVEDKAFLAMSMPSKESLDSSRDLSPSVRRKLIHLEQIKAILHRRNSLIEEFENQIDMQRRNMARQERIMKDQNEAVITKDRAIKDLKLHLEQRSTRVDLLSKEVEKLTAVVTKLWNNPIYKVMAGIKRFFKGGKDA